MKPTISVAPREIADLAFRACRVGGCDASVADRVAHDIAECEVQRGCGIARLGALLGERAVVDTFNVTQRSHFDAGRSDCCVQCDGVDSTGANDPDGERIALAAGVDVDANSWRVLEEVAAGFVLSEAIIDAADTPTG